MDATGCRIDIVRDRFQFQRKVTKAITKVASVIETRRNGFV